MSWMQTLHHLRHGFSLEEAQARLAEAHARGWQPWSDISTRSTYMHPVCPRCSARLRVLPAAEVCAAGCGWPGQWRRLAA